MSLSAAPYGAAVDLLHALSGPHGIRASLSSNANYAAVFTRDGVMAGIAGLLLDDPLITRSLVSTLEHLRDCQGPEGQIASNYALGDGTAPRVSFGTVVPRIDAPLWYLIGVGLAARCGVLDPLAFRESVDAVVRLLDALEYNGRHLIYVPAGGDWADEYMYEGYILHDQVLRAWALRLAGETFGRRLWLDKAREIALAIGAAFRRPGTAGRTASEGEYPIAAFTPTRVFDVFDLATCSLLGVSGIVPVMSEPALDWIGARYLAQGGLPPVFDPVVNEGDPDWAALQRYQLHGFRNRPHEYHNGGIWPIWLGWLALALALTERRESLDQLAGAAACVISASDAYEFTEYFHGQSGVALGTPHMAYSATGIVFLDVALTPRRLGLLHR